MPPVAPHDPQRKISHDHLVAVSFGNTFRHRDEPAGQISLRGVELGGSSRDAVFPTPAAQRVQFGEPPLVAGAPGGHAITQPVLFHRDLAAELVLLAFFLLQDCVAPGLEF